jgi:hypothetical protein
MNAGKVVERYGSALDLLMPGLNEDNRRLRCGILFLRDRAMRAANFASWEAAVALGGIVSLSSVHGYAPMTTEALETLHAALMRMMLAATALETRGPRSEQHVA